MAASLAEFAIAAHQGGYGGQNARVLLGQILIAQGGAHARAFDLLCTVVNDTPAGSAPHRAACRKLRAGHGCLREGETSDLVAMCCGQCVGEMP